MKMYEMALRAVVPLLLALLHCPRLCVASISQQLFENKVDQFVLKGMLCHNNPGLTLAVVRDGRVLLAKGYGFKSTDNLEPVTNQTLFQVASLSKAFASALILKQTEEHKNISLSTKVRDILGRDDSFFGYLRSRYTTLEDLLAHRMGVPSNNNIRLDDTLTRQNLVERLKYLKAVGGFRTSFYYSNLMYGLVTYLSEVIDQTKWEDLVRTKLFQPLDMTSSTFVTTADPETLDMATGYQDEDGDLLPVPWEFSRRWGEMCGSGCVVSNSVDMAKWMLFHLSEGRNTRNEQVLDPDTLAHAHKPQNSIGSTSTARYYTRPLTPVTFSRTNYGLGWNNGYYRGFPVLSHTGSTYGYRASILLIPNLNLGIFISMTGDDPNYMFRTNLQLYITDLLSGQVPWLDTNTLCSFPEPWQPKKTSSSTTAKKDIEPNRPLDAYEGLYHNDAYGNIDVYFNKTSGHLTALYGFGIFDLYPKKTSDNFYAEGYGIIKHIKDFSTLKFELNSKGKATGLVVPSMESKMPPKFTRIGISRTQRDTRSNSAQLVRADVAVLALTWFLCNVFYF